MEDGTTVEDGGVILVLNGNPTPEPLIEDEQSHWNKLESKGLIRGWESKWFDPEYENAREKMVQNFGPTGGELSYRMRPVASRLSLEVLEELDERIPAVGQQTEDNPLPIGFWVMIHFMMKQQGYDWYDEIDASTKAIKNRLRSIAGFKGVEAAQQELRETIIELEDYSDVLADSEVE